MDSYLDCERCLDKCQQPTSCSNQKTPLTGEEMDNVMFGAQSRWKGLNHYVFTMFMSSLVDSIRSSCNVLLGDLGYNDSGIVVSNKIRKPDDFTIICHFMCPGVCCPCNIVSSACKLCSTLQLSILLLMVRSKSGKLNKLRDR